jgi:hypothetical protein
VTNFYLNHWTTTQKKNETSILLGGVLSHVKLSMNEIVQTPVLFCFAIAPTKEWFRSHGRSG